MDGICFFTIGYEKRKIDQYIELLVQNNIKVLVDVRKNALSRKHGFSKTLLARYCAGDRINYLHMPQLGIVADKRRALNTAADYEALFLDYEATVLPQQAGALQDLLEVLLQHKRVAITCFERDHSCCHRSRVAAALQKLPEWQYDIVRL